MFKHIIQKGKWVSQ